MTHYDLWKAGIPISKAWREFASAALREKFNRPRLSKKINPKSGLGILRTTLANDPNRLAVEKPFIRLGHMSEALSHQSKVRSEMQKELLRKLQAGELSAYGYLADQNIKAAPVEIPERFLEPKLIKWDSDEISAPPHEFVSVRILKAPEKERPLKPTSKRKTKRGRPPVEGDVMAAVKSLRAEHPDEVFSPRKKWVPRIRDRIHSLFNKPGSPKYGPNQPAERTIAKLIPVCLKALAKYSKR